MNDTKKKTFTLFEICQIVRTVFAALKGIEPDQVTDQTQFPPITTAEHPPFDVAKQIIIALGHYPKHPVLPETIREVYTYKAFVLWTERQIRMLGYKIVSPDQVEIRKIVVDCASGHMSIPKETSPDDLTMVSRCDRVCPKIAKALLFDSAGRIPNDAKVGMSLGKLISWARMLSYHRAETPPAFDMADEIRRGDNDDRRAKRD